MEENIFLTLHKQNALNYTKQYIKIVFVDHNFNVVTLRSSNFKRLRSVKKKVLHTTVYEVRGHHTKLTRTELLLIHQLLHII